MTDTAFPIIYTADVGRMVGFYRDHFEFEEHYRWPDDGEVQFVAMGRGDSAVGFSTRAAAARTMGTELDPPMAPTFELCLYVADVDATDDELRSRGVTRISAPVDRPWGERSAYFEDPDGNPIQVVAPME